MGGLLPGDLRLIETCESIDDRGLEYAEDLLHQQRHVNDRTGRPDTRLDRALLALDGVRRLTKSAA